MSDGINPSPSRVPTYQAPVQDAGKVEADTPKDVKAEPKPETLPKDKPSTQNYTDRKREQRMNGTARQAELNKQIPNKTQPGDSLKAAEKILENPRLSNEAKIAQLQKTIEKTDKAEFANFMAKYPNFSTAQKALIHSAISESPQIMERVADELTQAQQLTVVWNSVMDPLHGKSDKEENARLARADKGFAAWMQKTDSDTLNKALDGKSIDIKASAKLYGVLASDPARLIGSMGYGTGKLNGNQLVVATEIMNMSASPQHNFSRQDLEAAAVGLIVQLNARINQNPNRSTP